MKAARRARDAPRRKEEEKKKKKTEEEPPRGLRMKNEDESVDIQEMIQERESGTRYNRD